MSQEHGLAVAFAALAGMLILAAYQYGAAHGQGQALPVPAWKHGVVFRLHQLEARP